MQDRQAIEMVVKAYLAQLMRAARGAGLDETRAEDVTQATFATYIEKAANFDGRSHVRTWLLGILYRKIHEIRREIKRDAEADDIDEVVEQFTARIFDLLRLPHTLGKRWGPPD